MNVGNPKPWKFTISNPRNVKTKSNLEHFKPSGQKSAMGSPQHDSPSFHRPPETPPFRMPQPCRLGSAKTARCPRPRPAHAPPSPALPIPAQPCSALLNRTQTNTYLLSPAQACSVVLNPHEARAALSLPCSALLSYAQLQLSRAVTSHASATRPYPPTARRVHP